MKSKQDGLGKSPYATKPAREIRKTAPGRRGNFELLDNAQGRHVGTGIDADTALQANEAIGHKVKGSTIAELKLQGRERNASIGGIENDGRATVGDQCQNIREKAYEIWMQEGCPQGRELHHWDMATQQIFQD